LKRALAAALPWGIKGVLPEAIREREASRERGPERVLPRARP